MSEEIAMAIGDIATVEALRARAIEWEDAYDRLMGAFELHMDILACKQALADLAGSYYDVLIGDIQAEADYWRIQAADVLTELHAAETDAAALRACLADTLGFAWMAHRNDYPKYVADVRARANVLIAAQETANG